MNELPQGWTATTLGDLGRWSSGGTPSKRHPEYYGGDIPWVRTGDLRDIEIQDVEGRISLEGLANSSAKEFPAGTLLVAMYGATIGRTGMLRIPATTNQACAALLPDPVTEDMMPFLWWFFRHKIEDFRAIGQGGAQPNISQTVIKASGIDLPPLLEQRRIVAKLGRLSARSAAARDHLARTIKLATRAKQAILSRAFIGEMTADWRVEEHGAGHVTARGFPTSWCRQTLKESSQDISYGFTTSAQQTGDAPLFLRITDVQDYAVDWPSVPRCKDKPPVSKLLASGDIVIARTGATTGKSYLLSDIPEPTAFASYLIRVRASSDLLPEYLWKFMWSADYWQQITNVSKGTAQPGANASILSGLILPVPPLAEQAEIIRRIEAAFTRIDRMTDEASRAAHLLDRLDERLLAKAFAGELVPQDPDDEPADALLTRIREARAVAPRPKRGRRKASA